ncbi:hypothetical protein Tco_0317191 [Tanacetum coccineum]
MMLKRCWDAIKYRFGGNDDIKENARSISLLEIHGQVYSYEGADHKYSLDIYLLPRSQVLLMMVNQKQRIGDIDGGWYRLDKIIQKDEDYGFDGYDMAKTQDYEVVTAEGMHAVLLP